MGIFALNTQATTGAVLQMINHGIVSAALFMLIGVIYDRMHTRDLAAFGGVSQRMPIYAAIFFVMTMASVGLPGTNSFIGEFLILLGTFKVNPAVALLAAFGVVFGAVYMLWLYRKMLWGKAEQDAVKKLEPMRAYEIIMFAPLVLGVFWLGLFPQSTIRVIEPSVERLLNHVDVVQPTVLYEKIGDVVNEHERVLDAPNLSHEEGH